MIYVSQSFSLPREPHHSAPPSSTSIKVPVSTCSSDIILSLYFLWNSFDEKWVTTSCQWMQAGACGMPFFFGLAVLWWQGATQRLFQLLSLHHPEKNASELAHRWVWFLVELGMGLGSRTVSGTRSWRNEVRSREGHGHSEVERRQPQSVYLKRFGFWYKWHLLFFFSNRLWTGPEQE